MKRCYFYYLLGFIFLFHSCKKDDIISTTYIETIEITDIVNNTATSGGIITSDGSPTIQERGLEWCISSKFEKDVMKNAANEGGLGRFSCIMKNLQQRTTYYVRAYAKNDLGIIYGEPLSFTTPALPSVVTADINYKTGTSFITGGEIIDDGDSTIHARGVCWGRDSLLTIDDKHTSDSVGIGKFISLVENLMPGTKYYVRAYAQNAAGVGYGEIKSVTIHNYPNVSTNNISDISFTTATGGGLIIDCGGTEILSCGICWVQSPSEPNIKGQHTEDILIDNRFSSRLSDLMEGITYNVRAYATNSIGVAYGDIVSFQTDYHMPTVISTDASGIGTTFAICGGNVTSNGGGPIIEQGICYSSSQNPTIKDSKVTSDTGTGSYSCKLIHLSPNTIYYFRAYATNGKGTAYGEQKQFITHDIQLATISTSEISNITTTTAYCEGIVIDDGGTNVTERGICYSTSPNPTIADSEVANGGGIGSFGCKLTDLNPYTKYYIRAYATNSKGTAFGESTSFRTLDITKASVITTQPIDITSTSATCGGNVIDDGGTTVTERGICYGTSQNPTIMNSIVVSGSGTGTFSCKLTGLSKNMTYFVRAYAKNSKGIAYGEEISFITIPYKIVTITGDNCGWSTTAGAQSSIIEGITMTVTNGTLGWDATMRFYKYQTLTFSVATGQIIKIEFTCPAQENKQYGPGNFNAQIGYSYSGFIGTWEGESNSISFIAEGAQVRATKIIVTIRYDTVNVN